MEYTREDMLELIDISNEDISGGAWEAAKDFTDMFDWDHEWDVFDPMVAMDNAFISGIRWALEHLKQ